MAQIDTSIPFRAFQQQNVLEAGQAAQARRNANALGGLQVQGEQNALGTSRRG